MYVPNLEQRTDAASGHQKPYIEHTTTGYNMFGRNIIRTERKLEDKEILLFIKIHNIFEALAGQRGEMYTDVVGNCLARDGEVLRRYLYEDEAGKDISKYRRLLYEMWAGAVLHKNNSMDDVLYQCAHNVARLVHFEEEIKVLEQEYETFFGKELADEAKQLRSRQGITRTESNLLAELAKSENIGVIEGREIRGLIGRFQDDLKKWFKDYKSTILRRAGAILIDESRAVLGLSEQQLLDFDGYYRRAKEVVERYTAAVREVNGEFDGRLKVLWDFEMKLQQRIPQLDELERQELSEAKKHVEAINDLKRSCKRKRDWMFDPIKTQREKLEASIEAELDKYDANRRAIVEFLIDSYRV